jgi:hypothetical protein
MRTVFVLLAFILIVGGVYLARPAIASPQVPLGEDDFWRNWALPRNISQGPPSPQAVFGSLGVAPDGQTVYLVWSDGRAASRDIYYATSTDGGWHWQTAQPVVTTEEKDSWRPSLVVSGATPFLAWAEATDPLNREICEGELGSLASGTSTPVVVPNEHTMLAIAPRLALGPGELHLAVQGGKGAKTDILYSRRGLGATAWPAATVVFTDTASGSQYPALAVSADGQAIHLVWQGNISGDESEIYYLRGQRSGEDVLWDPHISLSVNITHSVRPAIALGGGAVHVVWGEMVGAEQYVRYIRSDDGGQNWNKPSRRIDPEPVRLNSVSPTDVAPALAVTPSGAVCVAWHGFREDADPYEDIHVSCSTDQGGTWGTPVNVSRSPVIISIRPTLAVGSDGILHLAWQELADEQANPVNDEYQIYYARSLPYSVMLPIVGR